MRCTRDEAEWGLECKGEAASRVENATIEVAGGLSDRGECRRSCAASENSLVIPGFSRGAASIRRL